MAIKFRKLIQGLLFVSSMGFAASGGAMMVYKDNFSAAGMGGLTDSAGKGLGIYYADEHHASDTFSTGLTSVDELQLTLDFGGSGNTLVDNAGPNSGTLEFTFYLNTKKIGSTSYRPGDTTGRGLVFPFTALSSLSGDWTLLMDVTREVCNSCGAVSFSSDVKANALELIQTGNGAIPEPNVLALLALGLAGFGFSRRRR